MNAKRTAAFERFKAALNLTEKHDYDLFEMIASFCEKQAHVGAAMAFHTADILRHEGDSEMTYNDIIAEVYRRVFFDEAAETKRFGVQVMEEPLCEAFADFMVGELSMDVAAENAGCLFNTAPNTH